MALANITNNVLTDSGTAISSLQPTITLTTTGTSGAATFASNTLNIPNYGGALTGYVPYTGATTDVVLGTNNLKSKSVYVEGDGAFTSGALFLKQYASGATNVTGYNIITTQTSGFLFSASVAASFKNFILDASSLTDVTQRTYTLPNASGTLALTSQLSSYLPLSGGTLTGALSGTSATFSSSVGIGATPSSILSIQEATPIFTFNQTTSNSNQGIYFNSNGTNYGRILNNAATGLMTFQNGLNSGDGYSMRFITDGSERMRITSGGFTKMSSDGTYFATGSYHEVRSTNTTWTQVISNKSAIPYGLYISYPNASPNVTGDNQFIWCDDSTNSKFIVWSNGNVVNRNNSYGAISDIKFKENISDATSKLSDLLKVKVRNYNLIGDSTKQLGVIAQELEEVFPNMVEVYKEKDSDETSKSVKYSVFVPMLIKAVQELKAELDTLKK
jgi:hypothetical protein